MAVFGITIFLSSSFFLCLKTMLSIIISWSSIQINNRFLSQCLGIYFKTLYNIASVKVIFCFRLLRYFRCYIWSPKCTKLSFNDPSLIIFVVSFLLKVTWCCEGTDENVICELERSIQEGAWYYLWGSGHRF